jgi:hypothetical protein
MNNYSKDVVAELTEGHFKGSMIEKGISIWSIGFDRYQVRVENLLWLLTKSAKQRHHVLNYSHGGLKVFFKELQIMQLNN